MNAHCCVASATRSPLVDSAISTVRWSQFRDAKTRAQWREVLRRKQNGLCALCGHRIPDFPVAGDPRYSGFEPTFDHIVPRAHGGEDELHNLRLVHRCCNHIRGDADGLSRIPPISRLLRAEPPRLPPRVRINRQGEGWCRNRDWKRCYPTLTSAWLVAFHSFVETGRVHTPYWCGSSRFTRAIGRYRITTNPWRFDPFLYWIGSVNRRSRGCGMWHLTSLPGHVLTSEGRIALPDGHIHIGALND